MSWSDVFFPDNPAKREEVIRRNQELRELMKNNFRATNQLIEVLDKHLGLSFSRIYLNNNATIKENCEVMIQRMHEIQAEVKKIDEKLKEKLEPHLYEKLKTLSLSVEDLKQIKLILSGSLGALSFVSFTVVGYLIKSGRILANIISTCKKVCAGVVSSLALGVLFMGVDMMISAILGAKERDQLEQVLEEYKKALDEFRPASEKFQDNITYVKIKIEMMQEEGN
uniref:Uncharacterized protein n=1 Tax=Cyprinus carpio TaxID=7962 RepID=A0A8C1M2D3_CYPCA